MNGTLRIHKNKNTFTISPANVRATIFFQVSYPTADSKATEPFIFMQDASHKQALLMEDDVADTAIFYVLLNDIVRSIKRNLVPEGGLERFMIDNLEMKVVRK